jgi:hypothetical protein
MLGPARLKCTCETPNHLRKLIQVLRKNRYPSTQAPEDGCWQASERIEGGCTILLCNAKGIPGQDLSHGRYSHSSRYAADSSISRGAVVG